MRKSNILGGIIDKLELYEAELNAEIKRFRDPKHTPARYYSILIALDQRNLAMKSLKQLLL